MGAVISRLLPEAFALLYTGHRTTHVHTHTFAFLFSERVVEVCVLQSEMGSGEGKLSGAIHMLSLIFCQPGRYRIEIYNFSGNTYWQGTGIKACDLADARDAGNACLPECLFAAAIGCYDTEAGNDDSGQWGKSCLTHQILLKC